MDSRSRLMRKRVETVLLIGTQYDAYVAGQAGFGCSDKKSPILLSPISTCVLAESTPQALDVVRQGEADLVMSSLSPPDIDPFILMSQIKEINPQLPAVLITSNPAYHGSIINAPQIEPFDFVFAWRGEEEILPSIIMTVEDALNTDHDVLLGGVQVVLLIEDEIALYSKYLPMLYKEISERVRELTPADAPPEEQLRRVQARTKILLANTYEDALLYLSRYGDSLCGVLSDLQYPKAGVLNPEAGLILARYVKESVRESIPVVVQSRDREIEGRAHEAGAFFIWKNSDYLLRQLRKIMMDFFGFGDFVFRTPEGDEIGRAKNLEELLELLNDVPDDVFRHHGSQEHYSTWLFIHGEHDLARQLRGIQASNEVSRAMALNAIKAVLARRKGKSKEESR